MPWQKIPLRRCARARVGLDGPREHDAGADAGSRKTKAAILTRHSKGLSVELRSGVHHEVLTPLLNHGPRKFRAVP